MVFDTPEELKKGVAALSVGFTEGKGGVGQMLNGFVKEKKKGEKEEKGEKEQEEQQRIEAERTKFAARMRPTQSSLRSLFAPTQNPNGDGPPSMQIKVVLRCRPLFDEEKVGGSLDVVRCTLNDVTELPPPTTDNLSKMGKKLRERFAFERVYGRDATQQELFEETCRPSIMNAIEGYNVSDITMCITCITRIYLYLLVLLVLRCVLLVLLVVLALLAYLHYLYYCSFCFTRTTHRK